MYDWLKELFGDNSFGGIIKNIIIVASSVLLYLLKKVGDFIFDLIKERLIRIQVICNPINGTSSQVIVNCNSKILVRASCLVS
jgi:hypothetical protein